MKHTKVLFVFTVMWVVAAIALHSIACGVIATLTGLAWLGKVVEKRLK